MTLKPVQSEAEFMAMVIALARDHGWLVYHARPAMMRSGKWATAAQGNGAKGWPDLFMVRGRKAIAVELKSEKGKLTPEQLVWQDALVDADIECHVWRPSQWNAIVEELT